MTGRVRIKMAGRSLVALAVLLLSLALPGTANAAWTKVETDRFIVYGDARESVVRDYARKLTTFDKLLRIYNPRVGDKPPRRKFEVYLVRDRSDLRRVQPQIGRGIAGFFSAQPQAVFAIAHVGANDLQADDVLFHEYAHHFMLEHFPAAYPGWFVEGWAEYFMTADITPKGVKVGAYNPNRVYWLISAPWVPLQDVLTKRAGELPRHQRHLFYGQAWLLVHYMQSNSERVQQLNKAVAAIAEGEPADKALLSAMGTDIAGLTRELRKYRELRVLTFTDLGNENPAMTVAALPESADDLLLDGLRLATSSPNKPDLEFLADVRRKAAKYPGDPLAELTLAHAEFLFGDVAAGEAIVKRRLAAQPEDAETLWMAGLGQFLAGTRNPSEREKRWRAARPHLASAYKLRNTDFRPLFAYAQTRTIEPTFPTENDLNVLLEARGLAPSMGEASFLTGVALLARNRTEEARRLLGPVANNPHGGPMAVAARALLRGKSAAQAQAEAASAPADEDAPPGDPPEDAAPPAKSKFH